MIISIAIRTDIIIQTGGKLEYREKHGRHTFAVNHHYLGNELKAEGTAPELRNQRVNDGNLGAPLQNVSPQEIITLNSLNEENPKREPVGRLWRVVSGTFACLCRSPKPEVKKKTVHSRKMYRKVLGLALIKFN